MTIENLIAYCLYSDRAETCIFEECVLFNKCFPDGVGEDEEKMKEQNEYITDFTARSSSKTRV